MLARRFRPVACDVGKHRPDLLIIQLPAIRGHVALISGRCIRRAQSVTHDGYQHRVRVMPGMATVVMRRCRQTAIGFASSPVRLPLQAISVAGSAVLPIQLTAELELRRIRCRQRGKCGARPEHVPPSSQRSRGRCSQRQPEPDTVRSLRRRRTISLSHARVNAWSPNGQMTDAEQPSIGTIAPDT